MAGWKKVMVLLICGRLAGLGWAQAPASALDYLTEGIAAYEQGQWRECADTLEKALAEGFENPLYRLDALVFLGRAHARLGQAERARAYFRQVLEIQPDYRLDPADEAGVALFAGLLEEGERPEKEEKGGLPVGKIGVVVAAAGAAVLWLLLGGGGEGEDQGSIEGEIELP